MLKLIMTKKGQVLVLFVLFLGVLLGVAALALDLGRGYGVKARLQAAVDAASFEATKALAQGGDENAQAVGRAYFRANFPADYLGATPMDPIVTPGRNSQTGFRTVTVSASAQMPALLALGGTSLSIGATSVAQRKTIDMALVIDKTTSLNPPHDPHFPEVQKSAEDFLDFFSEEEDRVALVAFASGAAPIVSICRESAPLNAPPNPPPPQQNPAANSLGCDPGFNRGGVKGAIALLSVSDYTNSEQGLKKALYQLNSLQPNVRSGTRAIVFFSDGAPNTFQASFNTAGGTISGNLFSELYDPKMPWNNIRPHKVCNPTKYDDEGRTASIIAPLPAMGGDPFDRVPLASYNNMRTLSGGNLDTDLHCDVNKAARNLAENAANIIRSQGIYIFTLGFGPMLNENETSDCGYSASEHGANILRRIANTTDSDTHNQSQPSGVYCEAPTVAQLRPCFEQIANALLRITR